MCGLSKRSIGYLIGAVHLRIAGDLGRGLDILTTGISERGSGITLPSLDIQAVPSCIKWYHRAPPMISWGGSDIAGAWPVVTLTGDITGRHPGDITSPVISWAAPPVISPPGDITSSDR